MANELRIENGIAIGWTPVTGTSGNNVLVFDSTTGVVAQVTQASIRGTIVVADITDLTASAAELNKMDGVTATTAEINFIDGVTSNIQTQLDSKQATITGAASTVVTSNLTANRALISSGTGKIDISAVTNTELGYLSGVTSNIQTQLGTKLTVTQTAPADGDVVYYNGSNWVNLPRGTTGQVLQATGSSITWGSVTANGLTAGGTANQFLVKQSGTDYDAAWETLVLSAVTDVSATAAEVNVLSGITATVTELNYTDGVTSNIQTQLDNKLDRSLANNAMFIGNASNIPSQLSPGTTGDVLTIVAGSPTWQAPTPPGDVSGPGSSTDTALARWNGVSGDALLDSSVLLDGSGNITGVASLRTLNQGGVILRELTASGTNAVTLRAAGTMGADYTITFPAAAPGSNTFLKYDGADYVWDSAGAGSVTSVSGTTNRITISGTASDPIVDISASYVGQATITTLGTVTTGTWNGTTIAVARGGTGLTSLGTANQILRVNAGATALEYFNPPYLDGDKGDITLSSSGTVWTVDTNINKAWTGTHSFVDGNFSILGSSDSSKIAKFEVDGFTTATTRTFTLPNASGTVALTSDIPSLVSGSGTTYTSSRYNLGGTLTSSPTINGGGNYNFTLDNMSIITLESYYNASPYYTAKYVSDQSGGINLHSDDTAGGGADYADFNLNVQTGISLAATSAGGATSKTFTLTSSTISVSSIGSGFAGITYGADYSANYTTRSLPDKAYVDSKLGGKALDTTVTSPGVGQNGYVVSWNNTNNEYELVAQTGGGGGGYDTVQEDGTPLTQRTTLNFVGTGITAVDDTTRTNVSLNATLAALASYNSDGILTQTAASTFVGRTITGTANRISITNGDGVAGQPTIDVGANIVDVTVTNTYTAGARQIFTHNSTNAGIRVAEAAGAPSSLGNGDLWLDSTADDLYMQIDGVSTAITRNVIEDVATTTYSFVEADRNKIKRFTHASGCTATIPVSLSTNWSTTVYRGSGAGTLTIASAGTLEGAGSTLDTEKTAATIHHRGSNVHLLLGAVGSTGGLSGLTSGQVMYATSSTTIGGEAGFEYDSATNLLSVQSIYLGTTSTAGDSRFIAPRGSATDVWLTLDGKGTYGVRNISGLFLVGEDDEYTDPNYQDRTFYVDTTGASLHLLHGGHGELEKDFEIQSADGYDATHVNGRVLSIIGGNAYASSGNGNGGQVVIRSGQRRTAGSGTDGNILIDPRLGWVEMPNTTSIGTVTADRAAMYVSDIAAGNAAPHFKTELGQVIKLYQTNAGSAYSVTNGSTDRTFDANSTSLDELADVLATLIADLKNTGLIA